jgi:hypothetical protein
MREVLLSDELQVLPPIVNEIGCFLLVETAFSLQGHSSRSERNSRI